MSFRLFIYYCALCGGWAALAGWLAGRPVPSTGAIEETGLKGLLVGLVVALGIGIVDALAAGIARRPLEFTARLLVAILVGAGGGFLGGIAGQALYNLAEDASLKNVFLVVGWAITGMLVGCAVGVYDVVARWLRGESGHGARRKLRNGLLGGVLGGMIGGGLLLVIESRFGDVFEVHKRGLLLSPTAIGFIVLGLSIGLLTGLAQVILREAWLRVESGFRPGRELLLAKPEVTIGRAESCDVGLFGDASVEREHARIRRERDAYYVTDTGTASGTFVNDVRISQPTPIRSGDRIRVGTSVLRFGERAKRTG